MPSDRVAAVDSNLPDRCDDPIFAPCPRNDTEAVGDGERDGDADWGNDSTDSARLPLPSPAVSQSWTAWPGKWGAPPDHSPTGPAYGSNGAHFSAPWNTECADDNPDCPGVRASSVGARIARRVRANDRCGTRFGGGVVAAACAPARLRAAVAAHRLSGPGCFTISLPAKGRATDSHRRRFVTGSAKDQDRAATTAGRPGGHVIKPASARRTALWTNDRPRIRRMERHGRWLTLVCRSRGMQTRVDLSATRRGRALFERSVRSGGAAGHELTLVVPRNARYVRLASVRRDGARSQASIARLPAAR